MTTAAPPRAALLRDLTGPDPQAQRAAAQDLVHCGCADLADRLPALLASEHSGVQQAALDAMVALAYCPDAQVLGELMLHSAPAVRSATIELLERLGPCAADALAHLANHDSTDVRIAIAQLLGRTGQGQWADVLTRLLDDPEVNVRVMAAESAAAQQDLAVIPALLRHIQDDPWVCCAVVGALGRLGVAEVAEAIDQTLRAALARDDIATAQACVDALCRLGEKRYLKILLGRMLLAEPAHLPLFRQALGCSVSFLQLWPVLREIESELIELAVSAESPQGADLGDLGELGGYLSPPAAWTLLRFTAGLEEDDARHGSLLAALSRSCTITVLTQAAADEDDAVATVALAALGRREWLNIGRLFEQIVLEPRCSAARKIAVLHAAARLNDASATGLVAALLEDANGHVRAAAAAAAGTLRCHDLRSALQQKLLSDYPDVASAAAEALTHLEDGPALLTTTALLLPSERKRYVLQALREIDNPAAWATITECLRDASHEVRAKAAEILLSRPTGEENSTREMARRMLAGEDAFLRRAAARSLRPETAQGLVGTIRELLGTRNDPWELYELIRLCQRCRLRECEADLLRLLETGHPGVTIAAVEALGTLGCLEAIHRIAVLADGADTALAQAAQTALNDITTGGTA